MEPRQRGNSPPPCPEVAGPALRVFGAGCRRRARFSTCAPRASSPRPPQHAPPCLSHARSARTLLEPSAPVAPNGLAQRLSNSNPVRRPPRGGSAPLPNARGKSSHTKLLNCYTAASAAALVPPGRAYPPRQASHLGSLPSPCMARSPRGSPRDAVRAPDLRLADSYLTAPAARRPLFTRRNSVSVSVAAVARSPNPRPAPCSLSPRVFLGESRSRPHHTGDPTRPAIPGAQEGRPSWWITQSPRLPKHRPFACLRSQRSQRSWQPAIPLTWATLTKFLLPLIQVSDRSFGMVCGSAHS